MILAAVNFVAIRSRHRRRTYRRHYHESSRTLQCKWRRSSENLQHVILAMKNTDVNFVWSACPVSDKNVATKHCLSSFQGEFFSVLLCYNFWLKLIAYKGYSNDWHIPYIQPYRVPQNVAQSKISTKNAFRRILCISLSERDYVTYGYMPSQIRLSSSVTYVHPTQPT